MNSSTDPCRLIGSYPVCEACGASAVLRDAWAVWDPSEARWELQAVFDTFRCEACGEAAGIDWKIDEEARKKRIRDLNDALRCGEVMHGRILVTEGVQALGNEIMAKVIAALAEFSDFTEENDPHNEHDFGSLACEGETVFWKIDYYDQDLRWHSPDAANPAVTQRVLTIMLASEY